MRKIIISLVFALAILSACQKSNIKDTVIKPINVLKVDSLTIIPPDTARLKLFDITNAIPAIQVSFWQDVIPVLARCENCHIHLWTPSPYSSVYYTNLVDSSYVSPTSYLTSKIYMQLSTGHPISDSISNANVANIVNWMRQGAPNN